MKRISKEVKAIADAHIEARLQCKFDDPHITSRADLMKALLEGKTFEEVIYQIEIKFMPISTIIGARVLGHASQSYKKAVYKGFNELFKA